MALSEMMPLTTRGETSDSPDLADESTETTIAVLFSATIWCGRICRDLKHQSTINQHRALSLKTFQAFVEATNDDRIKDSVLMSASRAIFGRMKTGFVSERGLEHDPEVNFLEIGHSSMKPSTPPAN